VQWAAAAVSTNAPGGASFGTVSVDVNGLVSEKLTGLKPSTVYTIIFCKFPESSYVTQGRPFCMNVSSVTSDAAGNAQGSFQFPQSGSWSGQFFFDLGDTTDATSFTANGFTTDAPGSSAAASVQLVPEFNGSNGFDSFRSQDPLKSGTVTVANGQLTLTLNGAVPNATYNGSQCFVFGSSGCHPIPTVKTDADGNATVTFTSSTITGWNILLEDHTTSQSGSGFLTGFRVP
jgi:hypothetical protein